MLSVPEALALIVETVGPLPRERVPLLEGLGLRLAEPVAATSDSPPFDKALMDGYAVRSADLASGLTRFPVVGEVAAGRVATSIVGTGEALRIMTGAPLPEGADCVVPVELTRTEAGEAGHFLPWQGASSPTTVVIEGAVLRSGANILYRGASARTGDVVLTTGTVLAARHVGILAELGHNSAPVCRRPRVGILATGDELVPIDAQPGPGQIRNSNEMMLAAQVTRMGAVAVPLGIAKDERSHLAEKIAEGLQCDALLLSGGVSAGLLDLVPSCLAEAGVREVFHKVRLKPGQPIWFGQRDGDHRCVVFGLPGNPVSSLVCCELFVQAAVLQMMGEPSPGAEGAVPPAITARLEQPFRHRGQRPTYHPARLIPSGSSTELPSVATVPWSGSADLCATASANALVVFEAGDRDYAAGSLLPVLPLDR